MPLFRPHKVKHRTGGTLAYMPPEVAEFHRSPSAPPPSGGNGARARVKVPFNPYLHDAYSFGMTLVAVIMGPAELEKTPTAVVQEAFHWYWADYLENMPLNNHYNPTGRVAVKINCFANNRLIGAFRIISQLIEFEPSMRPLITEELLRKLDY